MALQTSASEMGARDKKSEYCERGWKVHRVIVIVI
jgi:hypothetical protein